ncbi:hypothetical protein N7519_008454 [Penicillium mononematosum]|uniref:uncharacterized protein n=1 Tax=Penicillium mononematosum TaxID=268346 RepID=UPI002548E06B|nr:uncharacterized protein N7519_008454 [Penicillium mononematosum]KAJ6177993.1 hypothetical protein N7519_008454 [Penicillium mononematosum]
MSNVRFLLNWKDVYVLTSSAKWMEITRNTFGKSEQDEELTRITLNNLGLASHHYHYVTHPDNPSPDLNVIELRLNVEGLWRYGLVIRKGQSRTWLDTPITACARRNCNNWSIPDTWVYGMREPKPRGPASGSDHEVLEPTSHQDIPTPVMEYVTQVSTKLPHVNPADMSIDDT